MHSLPLLWRVFLTNATILAAAFAGLVIAPVRVSVPVAASEVALLSLGLLALLGANLLLLRAVFSPLEGLADTMRRHDPLSPGARAAVDGDPSVAALAEAFNEMLDRLESERRESALSALMIQEGERRRVARELHDEVGQTLTGVMLQIEGLALSAPDALHPQLDELRETARHGTQEVRRIARRLRPEALEDLGLRSGLAALATTIGDQAQLQVHRHLESAPALNREQELVIYRVAQEALTNVARHAAATTVELVLAHDHRRTVLTVDDDGRGLAPELQASANGIRGMRERAMLIGAELEIAARPGRGTRVRLTVPHTGETYSLGPMANAPALGHAHSDMPLETEILLCDCTAGLDDRRRFAVLDELTLTYDVVERQPREAPRVLRAHVASLREARTYACARETDGVRCPYGRG